ncbi:MAG: hypothetical protein EOP05_18775, partial [Proteobacteria bacterium]
MAKRPTTTHTTTNKKTQAVALKKTNLRFAASLSDRSVAASYDQAATLLIFDRRLEKISAEFKAFSRQFKFRYSVESGEALKDLNAFPQHVKALSEIASELPPRTMTVLVAGGGSVGDFAG